MICNKRAYYECIIPERNKNAFYELIAGKDLFGFVVIRRWGRIGCKGRPLRKRFASKKDMLKECEKVHKKRLKRKYLLKNLTTPPQGRS